MTTTTLALKSWATGGCHCGKVRFKVWIESLAVIECNCSICVKKGFINIIAKPEHFELTQGEENLATYQFNTMVAEHRFCKTCGIHTHTRPRSHPDAYDINARCLDADIATLNITPFDGQNWEANVESIQ